MVTDWDALARVVINAASEALCTVFYALEPLGVEIFWALSLMALLRLALSALKTPPAGAVSEAGILPAWLEWSLVGAATLLGAAVRLYGREAHPFWWDELLAVWIAGSDSATLVRTLASPAAPASDFTPPLFYSLLHVWQGFFGQGEGAARLLTVAFGVSTIPALHLLAKRLWNTGAGLAAAFLLAVSMTAVSFSQQVRAYSLLALLTVLFLLAAESLRQRMTPRRVLWFALVGVLFLHTHFVAAWVYMGAAAAYLTAEVKMAARGGGKRVLDLLAASVWRWGVIAGAFILAAICPLFSPERMDADHARMLVWIGLGLVGLLFLSVPVRKEDPPRTASGVLRFTGVFALPGLLFLPWMLSTRIWEIIAGKAAHVPGAYGLADLMSAVDYFTGLEWSSTPYLLLVGLLAMFVRKGRSAEVLCGWVVLAAVLAMAAQNRNMNLVRYLMLTQAGYPLLVAVAVAEVADCVANVFRAVGFAPGGEGAWAKVRARSLTLAPLLVVLALFGFVGVVRLSYPTQRPPSEDYRAVAAYLSANGLPCVFFESQNMERALAWNARRGQGLEMKCRQGCPRVFLVNAYPDGRPWASDSEYVRSVTCGVKPAAVFPGLLAYIEAPATPTQAGEHGWTANGMFLANLMASDRLALGGSMLHPTSKKVAGVGRYEAFLPECAPERLKVTIKGLAAGPGSYVSARAWLDGGALEASARIDGSTDLKSDLVEKESSGESTQGRPGRMARTRLHVEVTLYDDGSGAIYSSNAGLAEVTVSY